MTGKCHPENNRTTSVKCHLSCATPHQVPSSAIPKTIHVTRRRHSSATPKTAKRHPPREVPPVRRRLPPVKRHTEYRQASPQSPSSGTRQVPPVRRHLSSATPKDRQSPPQKPSRATCQVPPVKCHTKDRQAPPQNRQAPPVKCRLSGAARQAPRQRPSSERHPKNRQVPHLTGGT